MAKSVRTNFDAQTRDPGVLKLDADLAGNLRYALTSNSPLAGHHSVNEISAECRALLKVKRLPRLTIQSLKQTLKTANQQAGQRKPAKE